MTFKDVIRADIDDVFMDFNEFASYHVINGKKMLAIVDSNELVEREKQAKSKMDGVYTTETMIYIRAKDFGKLPAVRSALILDGRKFTVTNSLNEDGIYSVHLEANRS